MVGVGASTTRFVQVDSLVCSFLPTMEETNQRRIANKGEDAARGGNSSPLLDFPLSSAGKIRKMGLDPVAREIVLWGGVDFFGLVVAVIWVGVGLLSDR